MKAIVHDRYGPPDVLALREIAPPAVPRRGLLVRVRAAALNPVDLHTVTGTPYPARLAFGLTRPREPRVGLDFAGTVEAAGPEARDARPGEAVYGAAPGALAELVAVPAGRVAPLPRGLSFEQAAAVPVAGISAWQAVVRAGRVRAGQRVLVHGAAGGVGTFAVQIARALGARVTGVCGPDHVALVRSLGAERVIDYTREDFAAGGAAYDLLLDVAGNRPWAACRRALAPGATCVVIGGRKTNPWTDPLGHFVEMRLASLLDRRRVVLLLAQARRQDLLDLGALLADGRVVPVVGRSYPLAEAAAAFRHLASGHAGGKIVVTI